MPHPSPSSCTAQPRRRRGPALPLYPREACRATAAGAAIISAPAFAAIVDVMPGQATWAILAALGLLAVVIAALSVARSRDDASDEDRAGERDAGAPIEPPPADFARDRPADTQADAAARGTGTVDSADFVLELPAAVRTRRAGDARAVSARPLSVEASAAAPLSEAPGPVAGTPAAAVVVDAVQAHAGGARLRGTPVVPVRNATDDAASQLFLALHHVDLSIDVLRRHLAAESRPMPAVWVMLLDLCRTHGRQQAFREIAAEFHSHFNVCAPAWEHYPPDRSEPGLEAYPRIVRELTLSWGTHECRRLLDRLLYDTGDGARRGFTLNAYNDLIALRRAADVILDTIEQDLADESKVRDAFAHAAAETAAGVALPRAPSVPPLVRDLEDKLDADLRDGDEGKSALEREHPALADTLAREWGSAALAGRLCEMLARDGAGAHGLSHESRDDVEVLRRMAERLADAKRATLATG